MTTVDDPTLFTRIGLGVLDHLTRHAGAPASARPGRVVLVTSTRAGEGKSFVAQGLAHALAAQQDGEVAWVDAAFAGPAAGAGVGFAEILTQGSLQGLASAGGGAGRPRQVGRGALAQPSLLYRPESVRQGLAALRAGFALSVLDAPSLADCGALLAEVDACVMVVDARRTAGDAAQRALAAAQVEPERLAGVVLNHRPRPLPRWLGGD